MYIWHSTARKDPPSSFIDEHVGVLGQVSLKYLPNAWKKLSVIGIEQTL